MHCCNIRAPEALSVSEATCSASGCGQLGNSFGEGLILLLPRAGRHPTGTPASKQLASGPTSRVLLYLTGHGGDEFLKFHDQVRSVALS